MNTNIIIKLYSQWMDDMDKDWKKTIIKSKFNNDVMLGKEMSKQSIIGNTNQIFKFFLLKSYNKNNNEYLK